MINFINCHLFLSSHFLTHFSTVKQYFSLSPLFHVSRVQKSIHLHFTFVSFSFSTLHSLTLSFYVSFFFFSLLFFLILSRHSLNLFTFITTFSIPLLILYSHRLSALHHLFFSFHPLNECLRGSVERVSLPPLKSFYLLSSSIGILEEKSLYEKLEHFSTYLHTPLTFFLSLSLLFSRAISVDWQFFSSPLHSRMCICLR